MSDGKDWGSLFMYLDYDKVYRTPELRTVYEKFLNVEMEPLSPEIEKMIAQLRADVRRKREGK